MTYCGIDLHPNNMVNVAINGNGKVVKEHQFLLRIFLLVYSTVWCFCGRAINLKLRQGTCSQYRKRDRLTARYTAYRINLS